MASDVSSLRIRRVCRVCGGTVGDRIDKCCGEPVLPTASDVLTLTAERDCLARRVRELEDVLQRTSDRLRWRATTLTPEGRVPCSCDLCGSDNALCDEADTLTRKTMEKSDGKGHETPHST